MKTITNENVLVQDKYFNLNQLQELTKKLDKENV